MEIPRREVRTMRDEARAAALPAEREVIVRIGQVRIGQRLFRIVLVGRPSEEKLERFLAVLGRSMSVSTLAN
jgi:aspartate aminotransferase-like enzyme